MSNNTARRGVYLPKELDDWLVELSKETDIKVNKLILKALNDFKEKREEKHKENTISNSNKDFESKVNAIIKAYNKKHFINGAFR